MENTKISIEELKKVVNNIEKKKDEINKLYETDIKKNILLIYKNINKSNNSYDTIEEDLKKGFHAFDNNMNELIQLLKNIIIPNYEDLSNELIFLFDKQFAKEIEKLLDIKGE